jgi:succinoglycan biosynthesis protein ExoO
MACYNGFEQLDRSVQSMFNQTFADWELLIIDDCSTDNSVDKILDYNASDSRIKLINVEKNGGPSVARNLGIYHAKGDWLGILDCDDAYMPDRLEKLMQLANSGLYDFVFDNLMLYDDHAQTETRPALEIIGDTRPLDLKWLVDSEGPTTPFKLGFLKPLMNSNFLKSKELQYQSAYRFAEDYDLYARALLEGARACFTYEPLYLYTTQVGEKSRAKSRGTRTIFDPAIRITIADDLLRRYRSTATRDDVLLIETFRTWSLLYTDVHRMGLCRAEWDLRGFFSIARSNPAALSLYFAQSRTGKIINRFLFR